MIFPCSYCNKNVKSDSIFCDSCKLWVHLKCSKLTKVEFDKLANQNDDWYCKKCYQQMFPFQNLDNIEYVSTVLHSNPACDELVSICKEFNVNCNDSINNLDNRKMDTNENILKIESESEYLTCEEFKHKYTENSHSVYKSKEQVSVIHFNCRSLKANYDEICQLLSELEYKFDVIAMSETWFKDNYLTDIYNIEGYNMFTCNRKNKLGGGVLLYISEFYNCCLNEQMTFDIEDYLEVVTIDLELTKHKNVTIGCLYRTPSCNVEKFNEYFCNYMTLAKKEHFVYLWRL